MTADGDNLADAGALSTPAMSREHQQWTARAFACPPELAVAVAALALSQLADSDLVELDAERKATMVANLMVVLSGDHSPTPVINTGSLYT